MGLGHLTTTPASNRDPRAGCRGIRRGQMVGDRPRQPINGNTTFETNFSTISLYVSACLDAQVGQNLGPARRNKGR